MEVELINIPGIAIPDMFQNQVELFHLGISIGDKPTAADLFTDDAVRGVLYTLNISKKNVGNNRIKIIYLY